MQSLADLLKKDDIFDQPNKYENIIEEKNIFDAKWIQTSIYRWVEQKLEIIIDTIGLVRKYIL